MNVNKGTGRFLYIMLWISFFSLFSVFADVKDDLYCYYNFTSDATDSGGCGIDGTLIDTPTHYTARGILDGYYKFDGVNDMIQIQNTVNSLFDNDNGVTFIMFVNHTNNQGSGDDFFSMGTSTNDNGIMPLGGRTSNNLKTEVFLRSTAPSTLINTETTGNTWTGNWTMFTYTQFSTGGNTYWTIYINGKNDTRGTYSDTNLAFTKTALGGLWRWSGTTNFMQVDIDEVAIYNRSVDDDFIQGYYNMVTVQGCNPVNNATCDTPPASATLTLSTTLENQTIKYATTTTPLYNGTFTDETTNIGNCSLQVKISDTGNYKNNITDTNVNITQTQDFTYTFPFLDDNVYFKIFCKTSEVNATTNEFKYIVDTTNIYNYEKNLDILELLEMLPMVLLYLGILATSLYLLQHGNFIIGFAMNMVSFGFDLFFIQWIYNEYINGLLTDTFQGYFLYIFSLTFLVWIAGKLAMMFFIKVKKTKG